MPQTFHRSANVIARVIIVSVLVLASAGSSYLFMINRTPFVTRHRVIQDQPVPFSHEHHVSGLGIDCRYCHTSVENSSFAGIPPTSTCMTCHSQIWTNAQILEPVRESYKTGDALRWTRVHDLPDFVYFNHSIHINKGVACVTCHGPVGQMPLMWKENTLNMGWCLSCHRHPEKYIGPRAQVFDPVQAPVSDQTRAFLIKEYHVRQPTNCSECHR